MQIKLILIAYIKRGDKWFNRKTSEGKCLLAVVAALINCSTFDVKDDRISLKAVFL